MKRIPNVGTGTALLVPVLLGALTACAPDTSSTPPSYDIKAGDKACEVEQTSFDTGNVRFNVSNVGSDVTEVYVYGKDGEDYTKVVGERENIGPGTSQALEVDLPAGEYQVACKPGMTGDGFRTAITVTGEHGQAGDAADDAGYDRELEFEIRSSGRLEPPRALTATMGQRVEFKLENASSREHYLQLLDPTGEQLGQAEAQAGGDAEFVAALEAAGTYQLRSFPADKESQTAELDLVVRK